MISVMSCSTYRRKRSALSDTIYNKRWCVCQSGEAPTAKSQGSLRRLLRGLAYYHTNTSASQISECILCGYQTIIDSKECEYSVICSNGIISCLPLAMSDTQLLFFFFHETVFLENVFMQIFQIVKAISHVQLILLYPFYFYIMEIFKLFLCTIISHTYGPWHGVMTATRQLYFQALVCSSYILITGIPAFESLTKC